MWTKVPVFHTFYFDWLSWLCILVLPLSPPRPPTPATLAPHPLKMSHFLMPLCFCKYYLVFRNVLPLAPTSPILPTQGVEDHPSTQAVIISWLHWALAPLKCNSLSPRTQALNSNCSENKGYSIIPRTLQSSQNTMGAHSKLVKRQMRKKYLYV